jgi:amidohydrolase
MLDIIAEVRNLFGEMLEIRRHIHQNPELSFEEFETAKFIENKLNSYGIESKRMAQTGVVALIGKGQSCIALRADIDALPILEETGLSYKSLKDGVMHACGHDMHTTMLLAAAKILKKYESELKVQVKLIFQPAEEKLPGGAKLMIEEAVLENPRVEAIFGQHIFPEDKVGVISTTSGPIMASADEIYWVVNGKSTHAAQPHQGNDPILASSQLILHYQTLLTKFKDPLDSGVLTVSAINGGTATNIIPDRVEMKGTFRAYNNSWREKMHNLIEQNTKLISSTYGCETELNIVKGYPPLVNNSELAEYVKNIAKDTLGEDSFKDFVPKMWAEDFAYYSQKIPALFWFVGVKSEEDISMPPLHNSKINPLEEAMINGTSMMVAVALKWKS